MADPAKATDIRAKAFRQIFTWPFVMHKTGQDAPEWFKDCRDRLENSAWEPTPPSALMANSDSVGFYEESVYFHDFIRDFLYVERADILTYTRPSLTKMTFLLPEANGTGRAYDFDVPFVALHVYRTGVAILTLEIVHEGEPLTLAEAQTLTDHLRRAYPPFWFGKGAPGLCPKRVTLHETKDGQPVSNTYGLGPLDSRERAEALILTGRHHPTAPATNPSPDPAQTKAPAADGPLPEPLFEWWRALLAPLTVVGNSGGPEPLLRQVLDERIPVMTTLSLTDDKGTSPADALRAVSEGDWYRLAGADAAGGDPYPYNPAFLETQRDRLFYDRFMPYPGGPDDTATRFSFAGYHFAAVGAGWFFDTLVTEHVRRHYRQMQHVCLLEFATLLAVSQKLCAARDLRKSGDPDSEDQFRKAILDTQEAFLDFTHRYHFTGVSNQLQARELFDRFRDSMELDARYGEIKEELASATALALAEDQRAETRAATDLTELAALAAVIGVAAALTGMNVIFDNADDLLALFGQSGAGCAGLAFDVALFCGALLCTGLLALMRFGRARGGRLRRDLTVICLLSCLGLGVAGAGTLQNTATCPPPASAETEG